MKRLAEEEEKEKKKDAIEGRRIYSMMLIIN